MRYLYSLLFGFFSFCPALAQEVTKLSPDDIIEIKAEARKVIETHLNDLLNSVTSSEVGQQGRRLIIVNSFIPGENQIFSTNAIIEDDTSPEYTTSGKGYTDLKVQTYLEKLDLFYTKSAEYSIKISEVNVTEVKQGKELPYVQVHFRSHFTNTHRNKPTLRYSPVLRTAEMTAEKIDNQWKVLITGIRYYKEAPSQVTVTQAPSQPIQTQAPPATKPVAEPAIAQQNKPTETKPQPNAGQTQASPPAKPVEEPATAQQTKPNETLPRSVTVIPEREVPSTKKPEPVAAEPKPAVTKAPEKTETRKTPEKPVEVAPQKPDAALAALQKKATQYKRRAILIRSVAGLALVGAAATFLMVNTDYSDYKTGIESSNAEFQAWWDELDTQGIPNGQNFGDIDNYKIQPKSIIEYGSPTIYLVGAGVVAAGVLWAIGGGSSRKARDLRNQLKQKKLSLSPQISGPQRYAGLKVRYSF